jgi:hypothetical protein
MRGYGAREEGGNLFAKELIEILNEADGDNDGRADQSQKEDRRDYMHAQKNEVHILVDCTPIALGSCNGMFADG